jgi:hypothetical protein
MQCILAENFSLTYRQNCFENQDIGVPPSIIFSVSSKFHGNYKNKGISDLCGLVAVQCKALKVLR